VAPERATSFFIIFTFLMLDDPFRLATRRNINELTIVKPDPLRAQQDPPTPKARVPFVLCTGTWTLTRMSCRRSG
jgi:hypothetical protein